MKNWRIDAGKMKTLKNEIKFSGVGLHSGIKSEVNLIPSSLPGIRFMTKNGCYKSSEASVEEDSRLTGFRLPDGTLVRTAEHLLASIIGMGLGSVVIALEGEEVPILDGSSYPFACAIHETGFSHVDTENSFYAVAAPVAVDDFCGGRIMCALPSLEMRVTYVIDYSGTPVGTQRVSYAISDDIFLDTISRARTFGLTKELDYLKKSNLAKGGSLENALVFDENGLLNEGGLRFPLECVTHKVIDLLGDLALMDFVPTAHYVGICAGHAMHGKLVERLKRIIHG